MLTVARAYNRAVTLAPVAWPALLLLLAAEGVVVGLATAWLLGVSLLLGALFGSALGTLLALSAIVAPLCLRSRLSGAD